ncbi:enoyl-CoA hydratase/isomerase family protein [Demetria terragena]|uniref:enoyl-CoA hydratase/isomerase family protein n=1 Tax=Demetria terragena TaxID=63959 RepID=UPI0003602038|nr:enoyl-CoA hydratase/isomerase family protein [Demetria terragena]
MPTSDRPHDRLRVERDGPLMTVTLDYPTRHNAQIPSLWIALAEIGHNLPEDVRVVVIRGEGPSFSSGLDRAALTPGGVPGERDLPTQALTAGDGLADEIAQYQEGFAIWRKVPAITVAAVQGHAIGAGFQLALACDLRIVADDVQFAMRETSLGLVPDLTGTHPLVQLIGYSRALEVCLTGRSIGAQQAVDWGLASIKVPAAELAECTRDLADAVLSNNPNAVRELKALLRSAEVASPAQQHLAERTAQARLLSALVGSGE